MSGAFAGGIAVGKSQDTDSESTTVPAQGLATASFRSQPTSDQQSLDQLRQRIKGGDVSDEEMDQLRQQFQASGGFGPGAGRSGADGQGGLIGAIEEISGDTLTVNTPQGPLRATIGPETVIQLFGEGTAEDLQAST